MVDFFTNTFELERLKVLVLYGLAVLTIQTGLYLVLKLARKVHFVKNEELKRVISQNLHSLNWLFCFGLAANLSLVLLNTNLDTGILSKIENITSLVSGASFLILSYFGIFLTQQWLIYIFRIVVESHQKDGEKFDPDGLGLITTLIKVVVWIVGLIILLENFQITGVDTLITSLGITGLAIAFGLQNVSSEIFSSFSIFLDKPFIVGDYVELGSDKGYIQTIGLRSTRILSLSGEEIVISNKELVSIRIHNFKLLKSRGVLFNLYFDQNTSVTKLKTIPDLLENIIVKQPNTKFERASFIEICERKYKFEVVYRVLANDYKSFISAQQDINFAILEHLEIEKIELIKNIK